MSKTTPQDATARRAALVRAVELQNQGADEAAQAAFRELLEAQPNDPISLYSLAALLMKARDFAQALTLTERGTATSPGFGPLWFAHAMVLQAFGRNEEALAAYEQAIAAQPGYTEAMINSGALLREMHRHKPALERFTEVLAVDPNHASALGNAAIMLTEFKQNDRAIAMFERLLQLSPDYPYGLGLLCYERMHICDWAGFDELSQRIVSGVRAGKRVCKSLGLMAITDSAEAHFQAARLFAEQWVPKADRALWNGEAYAHERLRIAYVSPDLREHPVGHLMAGVFERHDKSRFETFAFSLGVDDGSRLRARMQACFDHFIDVRGMGTLQIAELMREHEIDIAIDLAGYTSDSRIGIFSHRPAPIQATFLGYPGTLATDCIDYLIADRHVLPPEHQPFYSEQVAYLPHCYLPTDGSLQIAERTPTRAECGLPVSGAVLCSFSHDYKIHPQMFATWMRLLKRLPGSVLWLVSRNAFSQANLRAAAEAHGVDASRLVFAERVPRVEDHLARYRLADVFLDTAPYNAHTTAADALMAGLPVATFMGGAFPARVAGSLLHAIGLPEMIADSMAGYEELVFGLVSQPDRLAEVKAKLAHHRHTHPLFDTAGFCRDFEAVLLGLKPRAAAASAVTSVDTLPADLAPAAELLAAGNFPQAELHLRHHLAAGHHPAATQAMLDAVAAGYGLAPGFTLVEPAANPDTPRTLLIKAWGYGFWSDVHHVLIHLLVAELTGRRPVVQWGSNSLFSDAATAGQGGNAFLHFFEPPAGATLTEAQALADQGDVYPPKWQGRRLDEDNVNKWEGPGSRTAAQYLFARPETLVVSDFYSTVSSLLPWIGAGSRYHGMSDDQIHSALFQRYLKPSAAMQARVDAFAQAHFTGRPWVAVHVRGSDKIFEAAALAQTNAGYAAFIDRIIALNPEIGVFLLTDSVDLHAHFSARYGERVVTTPALRSSSQTGVHMQGHNGRTVGEEVLLDALLATRCQYFVGNRESNVSLAIASLKTWAPGFIVMLGDKSGRAENSYLHNRRNNASADAAPATLAAHAAAQPALPHPAAAARHDATRAARTLAHARALPQLLALLHLRPADRCIEVGSAGGLLTRLLRDQGVNMHALAPAGSSEFAGPHRVAALARPCSALTLLSDGLPFAAASRPWSEIFAADPEVVVGDARSSSLLADVQALAAAHSRHAWQAGSYLLLTRQPPSAQQTALAATLASVFPPAAPAEALRDQLEQATFDRLRRSGRRIAIDGVFFRFASGISRLWRAVLAQWSASGFGEFVVVIDRAGTAPRLPRLRYVDAPQHQYADTMADRQLLQAICDRENIGLFVSTYYSTPLTTPSTLMVLDMIPEVMAYDPLNPQWAEKRHAIGYASAYLAISDSTAQDLRRFFPAIGAQQVQTTYCGCDFQPATAAAVQAFRERHGIARPYFMTAGTRAEYKNAIQFFKAFEALGDQRAGLAVVCTNANQLEPEMAACLGPAQLHLLVLSDAELQCAYSGALALAYPSRYEGFGLPVLEAMACACPVITCRISSIPEVGGEAVVYVDPDSTQEMQQALLDVQQPARRSALVARGLEQARQFSWARMAREVALALATRAVHPRVPATAPGALPWLEAITEEAT